MARYSFLSTWVLEAPIDPVFEAIHDAERWPEWWRGVTEVVKLEDGDQEGRGSLGRYSWRSRLPYVLTFEVRTTRVERPFLMEGEAVGALRGRGTWRLREGPGPITTVTYEWRVETTKPWMNALAPVARPIFAWNHDVVMRWGREGLVRRLS